MKRTGILMAIFTLFLAVAAISAQEKTINFTGNWELDAGKSNLNERMRGASMSMSVTQTDTELKIQNTTKRPTFVDGDMANNTNMNRGGGIGRGGFIDGTIVYNLTGNETKNETNTGTGGSTTLKAEFERDGKLKLTNVRSFNMQTTGGAVTGSMTGSMTGGMTMTVRETWELADGGKTLKIFREMESSRGTNSSELVFTKKDATTVSDSKPTTDTTMQPVPRQVSGGVLNSKATNLVKPKYPDEAREANAGGAVNVQITIDEQGNVVSAQPVSGNVLLWAAAQQAAQASKFAPTTLSGVPVRVTGIIVYNFVP